MEDLDSDINVLKTDTKLGGEKDTFMCICALVSFKICLLIFQKCKIS